MSYFVGDRVQVPARYHWARSALGTIGPPPGPVVDLVPNDAAWTGCRLVVQGVAGPIEFYWVVFDEPQVDADGDGRTQRRIAVGYLQPAGTTAGH